LEENTLRAMEAFRIAAPLEWKADLFVSSDAHQIKAAKKARSRAQELRATRFRIRPGFSAQVATRERSTAELIRIDAGIPEGDKRIRVHACAHPTMIGRAKGKPLRNAD